METGSRFDVEDNWNQSRRSPGPQGLTQPMKPWDDTNVLAKRCITYCSPALISREGELVHNPQQWESQKAVHTKLIGSFGVPTLSGQLTPCQASTAAVIMLRN